MFNAQFARTLNSIVIALSDRGLPCGTAEAVIEEVCTAEVKARVELFRDRLNAQTSQFVSSIFDSVLVTNGIHRR